MIDKNYCMSSYLTFRFIEDENINFFENMSHKIYKPKNRKYGCSNYLDIEKAIKEIVEREYIQNKTAILLSGGMDSAILASYMPKGTKAYTLKCISDNAIDETNQAKKYTEKYDLEHKIIEITWDDYLNLTPKLMKYDGVPIHSIEPQLLKAANMLKKTGLEKIFTGASSDFIFGGYDKLLSKDWTYIDFIKRYTFVDPNLVLKEPISMENIFLPYKNGSNIDFLEFMQNVSLNELHTSYINAFSCGNIKYIDPYSYMFMKEPLDLHKIRSGQSKYLIRELFKKRYPEIEVPEKIPLPRSVNDWLKNWEGPKRKEFKDDININNFTGDQKWLIFCLELFLNLHDEGKL
ncbi:asparagine synthase-related protein [Brachyspira aalborgi]|uniref:asparagine synthase-related protein n=1 Tax=Brachyspira aalborgi TaxID=29522 RepID=UPI00266C23C3|nr:asparagine synthase-related protein [Brachyspira aalborgi]